VTVDIVLLVTLQEPVYQQMFGQDGIQLVRKSLVPVLLGHITGTSVDAWKLSALLYHTAVGVDTISLAIARENALLMVFGREVLQHVNKIHVHAHRH
jgi:hypothetical protein